MHCTPILCVSTRCSPTPDALACQMDGVGTWVTRLECRRTKSRGPEGFQGPEGRRPLAIVFLLSILLYFFVGQTDGEERQTKSEPHLRSLGLSGHFHNCPPTPPPPKPPNAKTSLFRVFNINASTVCLNPIAFCFSEFISNKAFGIQICPTGLKKVLKPKMKTYSGADHWFLYQLSSPLPMWPAESEERKFCY